MNFKQKRTPNTHALGARTCILLITKNTKRIGFLNPLQFLLFFFLFFQDFKIVSVCITNYMLINSKSLNSSHGNSQQQKGKETRRRPTCRCSCKATPRRSRVGDLLSSACKVSATIQVRLETMACSHLPCSQKGAPRHVRPLLR